MRKENLFGGKTVIVYGKNEVEEWGISTSMFHYFQAAIEAGKFTVSGKAMKEAGLGIFDAQLERAYVDMINYKTACNGNLENRGTTCKAVYKDVVYTLHAAGVVGSMAPSEELSAGQWHLFADAVSFRAGKKPGDPVKWTSLATFKKAVISGLFNHAAGYDFAAGVDDKTRARVEKNLEGAINRPLTINDEIML